MRFKNGNNEESSATKSQAHSVPAIEVPSRIQHTPCSAKIRHECTTP